MQTENFFADMADNVLLAIALMITPNILKWLTSFYCSKPKTA